MNSEVLVSIVLPVYNEEASLRDLYREITEVCRAEGFSYEVIAVDDGSTDGSLAVLTEIAACDGRLLCVPLARNFGQTAALAAGFDHARGSYVVTMDSDLQNDPADISKLLKKCREGFDLVCGWRKKRNDPFFTKRLPSLIANVLIMKTTGVTVHDTGCTLKVFRHEVLENLHLYGEMHRFIPALLFWQGARITEIEVTHHSRNSGKSKYRLSKTTRVLLDLVTIRFLLNYFTRPIQVFGKWGIRLLLLSFFSGIMVVIMKYWGGYNMTGNPFLILMAIFGLGGVQLITVGLLGEINIRIYHELGHKKIYQIKK